MAMAASIVAGQAGLALKPSLVAETRFSRRAPKNSDGLRVGSESWRWRRTNKVVAVLRTSVKENNLIALETQRESENTFETADALWAFNQEPYGRDSTKRSSKLEDDFASEPKVEDSAISGSYGRNSVETDDILENAVVETVGRIRNGKSTFSTKKAHEDEFQMSSALLNPTETNSGTWNEAVAETAKILHTQGSSLGRGSVYKEGEIEVLNAFVETANVLQSGQSSFVGRRPSNAQKRRKFWENVKNTGFAKALSKDERAITGWVQRVAQKIGVASIVAKDLEFVKRKSEKFGPSLKEKVGEIVALRIIEDETVAPAAQSPWPQPYYPDLQGSKLLAADLKALESYGNYVQEYFRSFQVPLQNEYDPDQVAAYFHRRPHVLFFRLVEVAGAFGSVALQQSVQRAFLKRNKMGEISESDNTRLTLQTAESLKQALLGLGTTFIKVAQSLSTRPDLIGTETAKVLSELQDRLPPFPTNEAIVIIEEQLGCSVKETFSYLSEEPVAAASFGQVYRGCLISGEEVAVKVQRPNLLFNVARDVYILRIGMVVLKRVAKLSNNYALMADEIGQGLYGELDYRYEASNSAEFAMAHKHVPWMYVPKTLSRMTGQKLLIMEWLNGDRPYDLQCVAQGKAYKDGTFPTWEVQQEAKQRLLNMVNKGTEAALVQLLETGVMHADPHPGNILLSRDGRLQFIDFGLICKMEKKHQNAMLAAIAHLVNGEWESLTDDLAEMDVVKPTTDRFAVRLALERAFGDGPDALIKDGIPDPNFSFRKITKKFFKIAYKFRFRLPPYYTLVLRSLASLEGFGLAVNPDFKTFGSAYPYAVRRVLLDYTPTTKRVLRSLLLTKKREFKWDRISTLLAVMQKSTADRAAIEKVAIPVAKNGTDSNVATGTTTSSTGQGNNLQQNVGAIAGLLLSRQGVGLRRVIYEADTRALALAFASSNAAAFRQKIAQRLGETLFIMFVERSYTLRTGISSTRPPQNSKADEFLKNKRLRFLLKAMAGRLRAQPIAAARAGWTFVTVTLWAFALACHKFAVFLSYEHLDKLQQARDAKVRARVPTQTVAALL